MGSSSVVRPRLSWRGSSSSPVVSACMRRRSSNKKPIASFSSTCWRASHARTARIRVLSGAPRGRTRSSAAQRDPASARTEVMSSAPPGSSHLSTPPSAIHCPSCGGSSSLAEWPMAPFMAAVSSASPDGDSPQTEKSKRSQPSCLSSSTTFLPFSACVVAHLLPLNRRRRLARNVVDHTVDTGHLVHDAVGDACEHFMWDARPIGRHEIFGSNGTQGDQVAIGAAVAHHTDALYGRQHGEGLRDLAVELGTADLLQENRVGEAQCVQPLGRECPNDPNGKSRARERMAPDPILGQSKLTTNLAHLIFEEVAQRLNQLKL